MKEYPGCDHVREHTVCRIYEKRMQQARCEKFRADPFRAETYNHESMTMILQIARRGR
jgi:hypothetical protein